MRDEKLKIDRRSFILGMHAAFCEAVGGEAKKAAFGPPALSEDFKALRPMLEKIAENQGVRMYYAGEQQMFGRKFDLWLIFKFPEVLAEYKKSEAKTGTWIKRFSELLSYGIVWGDGADKVVPKMRSPSKIDPETSIIFRIVFGEVEEL